MKGNRKGGLRDQQNDDRKTFRLPPLSGICRDAADPPIANKKIKKEAFPYTSRDWKQIVGRYYSADTLTFESNVSIRKKTFRVELEKDTVKLIDGIFILPLEPLQSMYS